MSSVGRKTTVAALVAAALAAVLVPGGPAGLGLSLVVLAILVAAALSAREPLHGFQLACMVASGLLALTPLLRDAGWVVAGALVLSFALAGIGLVGGRSWRAVLAPPVMAASYMPLGGVAVLSGGVRLIPRSVGGSAGPAIRGGAIATLLLLTFGVLLASADGAFAHLIGELAPDAPAVDLLPGRIAVALAAAAAAGGLALVARREPLPAQSFGAERTLSPVEWIFGLGALVALLSAFVAVQFVVLFGGNDHVLETAGLTYSQYAREGFIQLVLVAVLVLAVVAGSWRWARAELGIRDTTLRVLLAALGLLTIVIVVSALHRLDLYTDAFGATRLRLIAAVACMWIGSVLALVVVASVTGNRSWLPRTIALLSAAGAVAFVLANPDARIAEQNVSRYTAEGKIDLGYNASLSADATPTLASLPGDVADVILARQFRDVDGEDGVAGFNLSRERARDALGIP